jgi:hypothetical protein
MQIVEEHQEALYCTKNLISVLRGNEWNLLQKRLIVKLHLQFIRLKKCVSNWHSGQDSKVKHWYILQ